MKFRNLASFGKRIEFWIIGEMIKEGHDVYIPMVDDMDIDAVVRKPNGKFIEVQIKARSKNIIFGPENTPKTIHFRILQTKMRKKKKKNLLVLILRPRTGLRRDFENMDQGLSQGAHRVPT